METVTLSDIQRLTGAFEATKTATLDDRISFQKTVFLLQELGALAQRFAFNWYVFGPYSPQLARAWYECVDEGKVAEFEATPAFPEKLDAFKRLQAARVVLSPPRWIELLACLVYLRKERAQKAEVLSRLADHQSYFKDSAVLEAAWSAVSSAFP